MGIVIFIRRETYGLSRSAWMRPTSHQ